LHQLGFTGPYSGGRHQFLVFQHFRLALPSNSEYSVPQLRMMVEEVEAILQRRITLDESDRL
jgi:hypothetical protein